jgi:hypothetical protein
VEESAAVAYEAPREPVALQEERADARVEVRGLEGTLAGSQVRQALDKRARAFGECHAPRAQRVPRLAGSIEFAIRVAPEGHVSQVDVRFSDVGDRPLERCFAEVIQATTFPRPNGGAANVTYTMVLGDGAGAAPERWEHGRIERLLAKKGPELRESCAMPEEGAFQVTAYVDRAGRVVTAGVAARDSAEPELLDCIAETLQHWRLPKRKKGSVAKVSFPLVPEGT